MKNTNTKLHLKKGDTVHIIAGDDKGKKGKVIAVSPAKHRAIVEGMNMMTKHVKPSQDNPKGGTVKKEAAIHISNLMVVDPSSGKPSRIGRKADKKGKLQRYYKSSGKTIENE